MRQLARNRAGTPAHTLTLLSSREAENTVLRLRRAIATARLAGSISRSAALEMIRVGDLEIDRDKARSNASRGGKISK